MSVALRILLVIEERDDRGLAALVLQHGLVDVEILEAGDALEFADHLANGSFSVAVASSRLGWAEGAAVLAAVKRRYPDCVTLLLGDPDGGAVDALVEASVPLSSRGFLHLPGAIQEVLDKRTAGRHRSIELAAYDRLLDQLPVGIFTMAVSGELSDANPTTLRILGFNDKRTFVGRQLPDLLADAELRSRCRALLERGQSRKDLATTMRRADGGNVRVSLSFWPVTDEDGGLRFFEGLLWDLSGLAAIGRHPLTSGTQLEQLASAVSHDLQDPLQLIAQYARLLMERHGTRMDEDAVRLTTRVRDSAAQMQKMIDGILEYSKLTLGERPFQVVNMNEAAQEAIRNLEASIEESAAQVRHEALPSVVGEPRQLIQLLQNLIGNAVKFRGEQTPRVTIGVEERDGDWLMSIADNGIGIQSASADRIFEMFQRLHTATEYPGTGLGLALCKRIAECHGGRIWVESKPGEGSIFYITISKHLPGDLPRRDLDNRKAS